MTQTFLLAGATGNLGGRIAHHLLAQAGARVRLLVRGAEDPARREKLTPLLAAGAEVVEADLADASSLDAATRGIDVIVSAVQGGPQIIIDGQVALARAGKSNGVRRILPSDFGLDLFKAIPGEHPPFNWRQEADRRIAEIGLDQVNILQGAFMDVAAPGSPFVDYDKATVTFWGDGHRPLEMTTLEDTARIAALVALDPDVAPGKFTFWGDRKSFNDVADEAERVTGKRFERRSQGDEPALRAAIADADPQMAMMLAYVLYMTNGRTAMDRQMIGRYPQVQLKTLSAMLDERLAVAA